MDNDDRDPLREELKKKSQRFRILIIGRANAGKSTILKRICDTTEEPEILDSEGNKVIAQ
jgi:predicted GTPase